jgi:5-methylcytosine-specific restriction endonuclease McrA
MERVSEEVKREKARARGRRWAAKWRKREYEKLKADPERWARHVARINAWRNADPERKRVYVRARRARIRAADGHHTPKDIAVIKKRQRNRCVACAADLQQGYHADHIVPLIRGGTNFPSNIQLLCPTCNQEKHARDPIAFMQMKGFLL